MKKNTKSKEWSVYIHRNKINGKVYIGITSQDPEVRWCKGKHYETNKHFTRAIEKYGWEEGFEHEVLIQHLTLEQANEKEKELIAFYDSTNYDKGYNITAGGDACNHTITSEHRKKIIESVRRFYNSPEGKKRIKENSEKVKKFYAEMPEEEKERRKQKRKQQSQNREIKKMTQTPIVYIGICGEQTHLYVGITEVPKHKKLEKEILSHLSKSRKMIKDSQGKITKLEIAEYSEWVWLDDYNKIQDYENFEPVCLFSEFGEIVKIYNNKEFIESFPFQQEFNFNNQKFIVDYYYKKLCDKD